MHQLFSLFHCFLVTLFNMANRFHAIVSITLLLTFFISIGIVRSAPNIVIKGRAYCDTCRAGFETTATTYLEGRNGVYIMILCII